jgi:hypothetical protein
MAYKLQKPQQKPNQTGPKNLYHRNYARNILTDFFLWFLLLLPNPRFDMDFHWGVFNFSARTEW